MVNRIQQARMDVLKRKKKLTPTPFTPPPTPTVTPQGQMVGVTSYKRPGEFGQYELNAENKPELKKYGSEYEANVSKAVQKTEGKTSAPGRIFTRRVDLTPDAMPLDKKWAIQEIDANGNVITENIVDATGLNRLNYALGSLGGTAPQIKDEEGDMFNPVLETAAPEVQQAYYAKAGEDLSNLAIPQPSQPKTTMEQLNIGGVLGQAMGDAVVGAGLGFMAGGGFTPASLVTVPTVAAGAFARALLKNVAGNTASSIDLVEAEFKDLTQFKQDLDKDLAAGKIEPTQAKIYNYYIQSELDAQDADAKYWIDNKLWPPKKARIVRGKIQNAKLIWYGV